MKLQIKLFAAARELAGRDVLELELKQPVTVADLRLAIGETLPALRKILPHTVWAVNAEYAGDDHVITEDSEVALIPPVSGG